MVWGDERCWVPICTNLPYFFFASTSRAPSAGLWLQGFSTYTCLPACNPSMAIGVCQWSGVAMVIASTSFWSKIFLRGGRRAHRLQRLGSKFIQDIAVHIAHMGNAGGLLVSLERR